jgi:hypothetical protein
MLDIGMEDKLESSVIRSLILNIRFANHPNFQFSDITTHVISAALAKKLIMGRPQHNTLQRLQAKVSDCVWGLILEGVFAPGHELPFLRVTEYGERCLERGELLPHDPDAYPRTTSKKSCGRDTILGASRRQMRCDTLLPMRSNNGD